ncbi:MAG: anti-sigma factor family protein [Candidatus Aminicenantales bacterium]
MTCAKVKKSLPLLAGDDIPARKVRRLLAHIDSCPLCRKELDEYRAALGRVKAAAREDRVEDWSDPVWKGLLARITAEKMAKKSPAPGFRPRWAMASGLAALILLAMLTLVFRNSIFRPEGTAQPPGPEVVSVTMVSQETGLQVVWFLNKNFEWKGDK